MIANAAYRTPNSGRKWRSPYMLPDPEEEESGTLPIYARPSQWTAPQPPVTYGTDTYNVLRNSTDQYFRDQNRMFREAPATLDAMTWREARNASTTFDQIESGMMERESELMKQLKTNKESLDPQYYSRTMDQLLANKRSMNALESQYDVTRGQANQFRTEEEYGNFRSRIQQQEWLHRYGGLSYRQLKEILGTLGAGQEKTWLESYAPTTMTDRDFEDEISFLNMYRDSLTAIEENYTNTKGWEIASYLDPTNVTIKPSTADKELLDYGYADIRQLRGEIEQINAEIWDLEHRKQFWNVQSAPDYAAKSQNVATQRTGDEVYNYVNNIQGSRDSYMDAIEQAGEHIYSKYDALSAGEIGIYNYLYQTQGRDAANDYLDYMSIELNRRQMEERNQSFAQVAEKMPISASIFSVPMNMLGGLGYLDVAAQRLTRAITDEYRPIDYNRSAMAFSQGTNTIRQTVAGNITDKTGVIDLDPEEHPILARVLNGKGWADVYMLGMSGLDSAAAGLMVPAVGKAGTVLLGGSAATQGMLDAVSRGATDEQALAMGFLNGAFEVIFETCELENLLGASTNVVRAAANQALTEACGEGLTSLGNTVADILVMADKSELMGAIEAYRQQGLSDKEAAQRAAWDMAISLGWDAVGGAILGSVMGTGASVVKNTNGTQNAPANGTEGPAPMHPAEASQQQTPEQAQQSSQEQTPEQEQQTPEQEQQTPEQAQQPQEQKTPEENGQPGMEAVPAEEHAGDAALPAAIEAGQQPAQQMEDPESGQNAESTAPEADVYGDYMQAVRDWLGENSSQEGTVQAEENASQVEAAENITGEQTQGEVAMAAESDGNVVNDAAVQPGNESETQTTSDLDVQNGSGSDPAQTPKPRDQQIAETADKIKETGLTSGKAMLAAQQLYEESTKYGPNQQAMLEAYEPGQDPKAFARGFHNAYILGTQGEFARLSESKAAANLTESQREAAYATGQQAASLDQSADSGIINTNSDSPQGKPYEIKLPRSVKKAIIQKGVQMKSTIFAEDRPGNTLATYALKIRPKDGYFDVVMHGMESAVFFFDTKIDAYTLSQIIRQRPDYKKGMRIRLLSCNAGNTNNTGNCVAQLLANELDVEVLAPTDYLLVDRNGEIQVGRRKEGYMKEFYPR